MEHFIIKEIKYCPNCGIEVDKTDIPFGCWNCGGMFDNLHERMVIQKIAEAIKEILWMARRYADGRQTFSAISFNDAYDTLRDIFGKDIEYNDIDKWVDHTLTENGKYFPYAQDGGDRKHFDAVKGRKYSNFSA